MQEQQASLGQRYISVGETNRANVDQVDWKTAPRNFKLYRGCPQIALGYPGVMLERFSSDAPVQGDQVPTCEQIGKALAHIYSFTRQCRISADAMRTASGYAAGAEPERPIFSILRRPVPAGGGLFPCEVYLLVGQGQSLPTGVYHYDAVHHALDMLRAGDYSAYLQSCLPQQEHGAPTLALLMSCFFWKSGYKYAEFGYRLQSLDVGVVLAQSVLVTGWEGWQPTVHYRFLDQVANQLLGLDAAYESVYALITLCPRAASRQEAASSSPLLPLERLYLQAEPGTEQGMSLARWPLLEQLHRASLLTAPAALTETRHLPPIAVPSGQASLPMPLPEPLALRQALYQRHSAMLYFRRGELTQQQVSTLLLESMRGYTNDLDGQPVMVQHTLLYCVINAVAGISPGIYIYHPEKRALELVQTGDMRAALQGTLTWFSHNMWNVSLCLFPVADYEQGFVVYGDRWYRIQNMEAGLLIQRLYLAAAALALGCQANLGYQTQRAHELLRLPARYRCLAQLMIAPEARAGQYYEQVLW